MSNFSSSVFLISGPGSPKFFPKPDLLKKSYWVAWRTFEKCYYRSNLKNSKAKLQFMNQSISTNIRLNQTKNIIQSIFNKKPVIF